MQRKLPTFLILAFAGVLGAAGCAQGGDTPATTHPDLRKRPLTDGDMAEPDDGTDLKVARDFSPPDDVDLSADDSDGGVTDTDMGNPLNTDIGALSTDAAMVPGGDVNGTIVIHHVLGDGTVTDAPITLSAISATASAYVVSATGFDAPIVGTSTAGAFNIPAVPAGEYYLGISFSDGSAPEYYVTDSRTPDISFATAGRIKPDQAGTTTKLSVYASFPTGIMYNAGADGTEDFPQYYSNIQFYSANAGSFVYSLDGAASAATAPADGAMTLNPMTSTYNSTTAEDDALVEKSNNDSAFFVLQTKLTPTGTTTPYVTPTASATLGNLTMTTNATTTVGSTGSKTALTAVPTTSKITLTSWQRKSFDNMKADITGGGTTPVERYQYLNVEAQPGGITTYGIIGPNPLLIDMTTHGSATNLGSAGTPLGDLNYGNPYPSTWAVYGEVASAFTVTMTPTAGSVDMVGTISTVAPIASFGPTISPVVGPVQSPTINTLALSGAQSGIDATNSTISWNAPSVGTANFYEVLFYTFDATPNINEAGRVITGGTSIKIPPGILTSGQEYFVRIRAYNAPGSDVKSKPEIYSASYGWADFISAIFTAA